jgi:hypothetical protein
MPPFAGMMGRALIQLDTIALSKFLHVDLGSEPPESHGIIPLGKWFSYSGLRDQGIWVHHFGNLPHLINAVTGFLAGGER